MTADILLIRLELGRVFGNAREQAAEVFGLFGDRPILGLQLLDRAVNNGYYAYSVLTHTPWLDSVRTRPEFGRILRLAESRHREAQEAYRAAGGEAILGPGTAQ